MSTVRTSVRRPVTVAVGVILVVLAGLIAFQRVPIQLTPDVEDTIISVRTRWEGASPLEVEQEIVDRQEERLQGLANLRSLTSTSQQGMGAVRLEFTVGTPKEVALREVSDKLREVPTYPENVDEPVVEASDPENRDFIAWFIIEAKDPTLDLRTLKDFADDRIKPVLDRVPGVSEVNVLGGREREVQVRFDPLRLAQRGVSPAGLVDAIRAANRNVSAGAVDESKSEVRVRFVNQYETPAQIEETVVRMTPGGPVLVRDVAEIVETYKEPTNIVRSRGRPVLALNAQKEVGANVMEVMAGLQGAVARLNEPGGVLESHARRLGLDGTLTMSQVYDQTIYIDDALALVKDNIWLGGALALGVLLVFLGSIRGALIIGLAIPISVVGAVVAMVALGRSINVISLAGMAFAVGMVVDNAIVVLENIFRHLEMGKRPARAAIDGAEEVYGAVVAATLTTVVVFLPILLVQEEAGQLFRDIALAIVAAVSLSFAVAVTVIPAAAARLLSRAPEAVTEAGAHRGVLDRLAAPLRAIPRMISDLVHRLSGSVAARVGVVVVLTVASVAGTVWLMPPSDYLPQGNRNLVFGLLIPPPGYNLEQQESLAKRIEATVEPYWEAGRGATPGNPNPRGVTLPEVPTFDFARMAPGAPVTPPPLENYFIVSVEGAMFHGGISADPTRIADVKPLFAHATRATVAPGVMAFAFQVPLFRLGGRTGSAVKVNFSGDDLGKVSDAALGAYLALIGKYGPMAVQPDPSNFNVPGPELQVVPRSLRLAEVGMDAAALGRAVQVLADGAVVGDYRLGGKTIDIKIVTADHGFEGAVAALEDAPVATPSGRVVPLGDLATLRRVNAASQINREGRQRSVTLQFTAPEGMPLEQAVEEISALLDERRAAGLIPTDVDTSYTGSASKLAAVRAAMLGDGTVAGTVASSLFLALLVVYLLMCVLFQSWLDPLVILFSVPLATLGGFAALRLVHDWTVGDPYMPRQNLDVLTMLGFIILIGVVVNNAILIVHQAGNFLRGTAEEGGGRMEPREAIAEAVRTRVRPIFMSTLTSVLGMLPLVLMPGSGSELYRGLGAVVLGGLIVSTIFTLILVPLLLSLAYGLKDRFGLLDRGGDAEADPPPSAAPVRPAPASAVVALVALAAALPAGCAVPGSAGGAEGLDRTLESIAARRAVASGVAAGGVLVPAPVTRLPADLEARRPALEELSAVPAAPAPAAGAAPEVDVTLAHAVTVALEHRLGVRALRVLAEADAAAVASAEAVFDAVYFSQVAYDRVDQPQQAPILRGVTLGSDGTERDRWLAEWGLRRRTETGATVQSALRLEHQRSRTQGVELDPDPSWWAGVTVEARQPLLRGFGAEVNGEEIERRRNARERTAEDLREEMLHVAAGTEIAFWDLLEARRAVDVRADLVDRAERVEVVLRERLAFDAAAAEHAESVATLELRRADLARARRIVALASDRLKSWMGTEALGPLSAEVLVPRGEFDESPATLDALDAVRIALRERPLVRRAVLDIRDADLREMVARDAERGRLDLFAGIALRGLDDDAAEALGDPVDRDFYGWSVGVSWELPVGNRAARAALHEARLRRDATFLRYEETVRVVAEDVRDALRDMLAARDLASAARTARLTQAESLRRLLEEEERRASLTPEFLALRQGREDRLASARLSENAALADFQRARAAWRRAVGALPAAAAAPRE